MHLNQYFMRFKTPSRKQSEGLSSNIYIHYTIRCYLQHNYNTNMQDVSSIKLILWYNTQNDICKMYKKYT